MKPTIAIFIDQPYCSVQSANGVLSALSDYYRFKIFTKHELQSDFFDDVNTICIPGGLGDASSFYSLMHFHLNEIRNFVFRGGNYLGICMGAYWAGQHFFDLMPGVKITQYIKQKNADTKRPHAKNIAIRWNNEPMKMFFYDGCTFKGKNFETIAEYSTGHPMAIKRNNIALIGCHPESEKHWYDSYSWMKNQWHQGKHKELLLDFVNDLHIPS